MNKPPSHLRSPAPIALGTWRGRWAAGVPPGDVADVERCSERATAVLRARKRPSLPPPTVRPLPRGRRRHCWPLPPLRTPQPRGRVVRALPRRPAVAATRLAARRCGCRRRRGREAAARRAAALPSRTAQPEPSRSAAAARRKPEDAAAGGASSSGRQKAPRRRAPSPSRQRRQEAAAAASSSRDGASWPAGPGTDSSTPGPAAPPWGLPAV